MNSAFIIFKPQILLQLYFLRWINKIVLYLATNKTPVKLIVTAQYLVMTYWVTTS